MEEPVEPVKRDQEATCSKPLKGFRGEGLVVLQEGDASTARRENSKLEAVTRTL
jgi:hypothetical protein